MSSLPWPVQAEPRRSCAQSAHSDLRCCGRRAQHACARQTASRAEACSRPHPRGLSMAAPRPCHLLLVAARAHAVCADIHL